MKLKLTAAIFSLLAINFCRAQESTVVLNTSMFDKYSETISLTQLSGWIFKAGNDAKWSKYEIDTTGWIKLDPTQLTAKNADNRGRLEGWLRMRFKLDSSFENIDIGIEALRWAATDIYIDGNYVVSYGNTGLDGKPYEENRSALPAIKPLQIETGKEHILAVHIVDHVAPLQRSVLKTGSLDKSFGYLIQLAGPSAYKKVAESIRDYIGHLFLYCGIIGFLGVLFWFLYLQNRREKNLLLISISTTLFFIWPLSLTMAFYPLDLGFNSWWLIFFIAIQLWPIAIASMVYTVAEIFSFKYKKALVILGILFVLYCIIDTYFFSPDSNDFDFSLPPLIITILLLCIVLSLWKRLRGAQWAVVAGIVFTTIFSFTWSHLGRYESGMYLSFPLSLIFYVAIRFKEILAEVQVNAKQVVQLSEEKREQAVKQQRTLEEEVARQTVELRTSLENLKSTQAQLIQSEKMASLGEMSAGIAHEIQNPLNFVNNFSEVNAELLTEMKEAILEKNYGETMSIVNEVIANEEKINHHGKRADSIVKGMLQHSRAGSGKKEPADINALADEYLRLAYHGLRAKDKTFNATLETNFDLSIKEINVVPQDIGRVLLNLYNNAFYAVTEKKKATLQSPDGEIEYEPRVIVSTRFFTSSSGAGGIEIRVKDNGNGIPQKVLDKIFHPFFTTKPTGLGTGLGLSLSYDIVTKEHGGQINVETKEKEYTEFIIWLPG